MTSRQLDCEFKNALVNSKLRDSLLMLFLKDRIVYIRQLGLPDQCPFVGTSLDAIWNAIFNDVKC